MVLHRLTTGVALAALAIGTSGALAGASTPRLVVNGNGLSVVHLGTSENSTISILTRLLGRPTVKLASSPGLANCGVSATAAWHSMIVFFDHDKVAGFSFGPSHLPEVTTGAGLTLGDTLKQARTIYSRRLTTSDAQGGVWFANTSSGRLDGYLDPSTATSPSNSSRIYTIEVGVVGCPAMSP